MRIARQSLRATHVKECSKDTSRRSRDFPSTVQLTAPGQNTGQDLMEEVPVHADVVHIVTSTLPVQLLEQHGPPCQPWLHAEMPTVFLQQLPLMQQ